MDQNTLLMIGISLLILILTLVAFLFWSRRGVSRRSILLLGLTESGKTLLFARLLHSKFKETYTSIKENTGEYSVQDGVLRIVDVPGHERVRGQIFDKYKTSALGLVYVIDSVTLQQDVRDVAEFLYTVLSDSAIQRASPPLLIICNKQDQPLAKSAQIIKTVLEKEINVVRKTKSSQLEAVGSGQAKVVFLGKKGKDFEFSHLNMNVEVVESCAIDEDKGKPANLKLLTNWISKVA